jgi:hypothetical protein
VTKRPIRKVHLAHVRTSFGPSHFLTSVATRVAARGASSLPDEVGSLPYLEVIEESAIKATCKEDVRTRVEAAV